LLLRNPQIAFHAQIPPFLADTAKYIIPKIEQKLHKKSY
jgi:hypothetical protein